MNRLSFLMAALLLAACNPAVAPLRPTDGGLVLEADERRLWRMAADEEATLNASPLVQTAPELTAYLDSVARRLVPETLAGADFAPRVRVLDSPFLNAFALPNGALYIHTGLLVRLETEAELATILGHELSHVFQRHGLRRTRSVKGTTALLGTLSIASPLAALLGGFGAQAALAGYGRDQEREADSLGFVLMHRAGYQVADAPAVFRHLMTDVEQTGQDDPFFFGTHPRLRERLASYERLVAATDTAGGRRDTARLRSLTDPLLQEVIAADLAAGRYAAAHRLLDRYLARYPDAPQAHALRGDLLRLRPEPDVQAAEAAYRHALALAPETAPALRGLGLLLRSSGRAAEAADALEAYLRLVPQAPDRAFLETYIRQGRTPAPTP